MNQQNTLAPCYFQGYCNTEVILTWVKNELLPALKAGMTVIWDNATFHKSPKIKARIESVGCQLISLPPYSPDLNPIEQYWSVLRAQIRRIKQQGMTIPQALALIFKRSINYGQDYTISLFIADLAFTGTLADTAKIAIMVASMISGCAGWILLQVSRVKSPME